jgi:hypothetical protein
MQAPCARLRVAFAVLAACLAVAASALPAGALSITPDPVVFNLDLGGGVLLKGNFNFVGLVTGTPGGGIVLDGSVAATDITLIFTAMVDSDSDIGLATTYIFSSPPLASSPVFSAVGTIPGAGVDVTDGFVGSSSATVHYDSPNELDPGETSDAFFLSFSSISIGDQLGMEYVVLPLGTMTVVPEPEMAALLLVGFGALGWHVRRSYLV